MNRAIVLDTGPLGLLAHSKAYELSEECNRWMKRHLAEGSNFIIPEIADYELRRELLRLRLTKAIITLESFQTLPGFRYLPVSTSDMRRAAHLWAEVRLEGKPTSHPHALDGDVILAAQTLGLEDSEVVVATTNVDHLARFVPAAIWQEITG